MLHVKAAYSFVSFVHPNDSNNKPSKQREGHSASFKDWRGSKKREDDERAYSDSFKGIGWFDNVNSRFTGNKMRKGLDMRRGD